MLNSKKFELIVSYLSQIKLKTQLLFLVATLGAAIVASVVFNDLQNEKLAVNGPVYNKIVLQKDLVADILLPQEYLDLEAFHDYWKANLAEDEMKSIMMEALYSNGIRFFGYLRSSVYSSI